VRFYVIDDSMNDSVSDIRTNGKNCVIWLIISH